MKSFNLDEEEEKAAKAFKSKHNHGYAGAIGGSFSYQFTPTSIGTGVSIICNHCQESENITNYANW